MVKHPEIFRLCAITQVYFAFPKQHCAHRSDGTLLQVCRRFTPSVVDTYSGWFRVNNRNLLPSNCARRFFEVDPEILHTGALIHAQRVYV